MSRLTIALIIAQNGLGTAAGLLEAEAARLDAKDDAESKRQASRRRRLAKVLRSANAGISEYLAG